MTERIFSTKTASERAANLRRLEPAPGRAWPAEAPPGEPAGRASSQLRGIAPPDLSPVRDALTPRMARHLLRRTTFGVRQKDLDAVVGMPADQAVDVLLAEGLTDARYLSPGWIDRRPPHAEASEAAFEEFFELNDAWMSQFVRDLMEEMVAGGLRQRLMLFWHDHFATSFEKYELAAFAVKHMELLRQNGLGSFPNLVRDVGTDPAMLYYLDGFLSDRHAPNENYARELLELFTMGHVGPDGTQNYTEHDVSELARALTGWTVNLTTLSNDFYPDLFDDGEKTIFGRRDTFTYREAIAVIFDLRADATAYFMADKLFREFVHQEPDPETVAVLAQQFQADGFHIRPFLRTLLSSGLFFDDQGAVASRIKSPVELLVGLVREYGTEPSGSLYEAIYWEAATAGQQVFFPPNVAGWAGHTEWLSTSTLPARWNASGWLVYFGGPSSDAALASWANRLAPPEDARQVFYLTAAILEHFFPVPVQELGLPRRPSGFGGNLQQFPIPDTVRQALPPEVVALTSDLLSGVPWYEWDISTPEALGLLRFFLAGLFRRPEFQLG